MVADSISLLFPCFFPAYFLLLVNTEDNNGPGGWRFLVQKSGLSVSQLGMSSIAVNERDGSTHTICLWRDSDQTLLHQVSTSEPPSLIRAWLCALLQKAEVELRRCDEWTFANVDPPIPLERGETYSIVRQFAAGTAYR